MRKSQSKKHGSLPDYRVRTPKAYPWQVLKYLALDLGHCLSSEEGKLLTNIIRNRDVDQLLALSDTWSPQSIGVSGDMHVSKFRALYQMSSLLKKYQFPGDKNTRKEAALKTFKAAEETCRQVNANWRKLASPDSPDMLAVLSHAGDFLKRLLGNVIPERNELTEWSRHGPGANLDTKDGLTSSYDKYSGYPYSCTEDAYWHARLAIYDDERWYGALQDAVREDLNLPKHSILPEDVFWDRVLTVVDGNRITFVPKNARTERSIAIEPAMNLYLQLGVDGFIRRRLLRWGVNLDDQRKNQKLAQLGSLEWTDEDPFVTLDLKAASDSISLAICRRLLPPQWYNYLIDLRSPQGDCEGETIIFEKISSMGNGYTFALESAIFSAIVFGCQKVVRGTVSTHEAAIYGDDIIVRRSVSGLLVQSLTYCGFSLNVDKTFLDGPFRESCGADWYQGLSVRPVFLTCFPTTVFHIWCDLNRLRRMHVSWYMSWESTVCSVIERWIPEGYKTFVGPPSNTDFDSYMHTPFPLTKRFQGMWTFKRVTMSYARRSGCNRFFFRRLMNPLRQSAIPNSSWSSRSWGGKKLETVANVYAVMDSKSVTVGVSPNLVDIWQGEYTTLLD